MAKIVIEDNGHYIEGEVKEFDTTGLDLGLDSSGFVAKSGTGLPGKDVSFDVRNDTETRLDADGQQLGVLTHSFVVKAEDASVDYFGVRSDYINVYDKPIINVLDPVDPQDAATKAYSDNTKVTKSGNGLPGVDVNFDVRNDTETRLDTHGQQLGVMTPTFVVKAPDASTDYFQVNVDRVYVYGRSVQDMADPTDPQDATTKFYVDAADSALQSGKYDASNPSNYISSVSADGNPQLSGVLDGGGHKITNLLDPTDPQDAATRNYVDTGGWVTAPSSASDSGTTGQKAFDSDFLYVCVATNTWVRAALSTW